MSGISLDEINGSLHSISITDSTGANSLAINASGEVSINDGGNTITVDGSVTTTVASDQVEDAAHTTGDTGSFMLAVRSDSKASSAGADGDYAALIQDADGDLYVSDTVAQGSLATIAAAVSTEMQVDVVGSLPAGDNNIGNVDIVTMPGGQTEDTASSGGETLLMVGGYRKDADTSPVSTDGDFHGFIFNATGELKTAAKLVDKADTSLTVTTTTVGNTAGGTQLSSPVANRREVVYQNLGSRDIWIKNGTGVTSGSSGNGFKLPQGSSLTKKWGANIDPYAITSGGTSTIKVIEEV